MIKFSFSFREIQFLSRMSQVTKVKTDTDGKETTHNMGSTAGSIYQVQNRGILHMLSAMVQSLDSLHQVGRELL
jgi:hypothetical protein